MTTTVFVMNNTLYNMSVSFDQIVQVHSAPEMIVAFLVAWLVPLVAVIITGAIVHSRTSSGSVVRLIETWNFWILVVVYGFISAAVTLSLVMIPLWGLLF